MPPQCPLPQTAHAFRFVYNKTVNYLFRGSCILLPYGICGINHTNIYMRYTHIEPTAHTFTHIDRHRWWRLCMCVCVCVYAVPCNIGFQCWVIRARKYTRWKAPKWVIEYKWIGVRVRCGRERDGVQELFFSTVLQCFVCGFFFHFESTMKPATFTGFTSFSSNNTYAMSFLNVTGKFMVVLELLARASTQRHTYSMHVYVVRMQNGRAWGFALYTIRVFKRCKWNG